MNNTRRIVILALMVAQALILSIVESWIPVSAILPGVIPGVKLGLANIITLVVIVYFGLGDALLVVIVRCALAAVFGGGITVFFFSLAGGVLSTIVMVLLNKRLGRVFSLTGVSIAGAISHNIGQILVAAIFMKTLAVLSYLPILMISGIIMGLFVGMCSNLLISALRKTNIVAKL